MTISILPGTRQTLDSMKGQKFEPHAGEGVVFIQVTFIKPETMEHGDPAQTVEDAPGVVLCGQLSEIREQLNKWFDDSSAQYTKE